MNSRRFASLFAGIIVCGGIAHGAKAQKVVVYSQPHHVDHVIKSMEGAIDDQPMTLLATKTPELLWVTSAKVSVVDARTSATQPREMLCHSHLMFPFRDFNPTAHNVLMGRMTNLDLKLFTLVQGQTDIELPRNFGIPVLSTELFHFSSMIISPRRPAIPLEVKAKGTFEFYRDSDLQKPLKSLFWRGLSLMVPIKEPSASHEQCASEMQGVTTTNAVPPPSLPLVHKHPSGKFNESYHWIVPPGRHEYRYTIPYGGLMAPFDTTLHYINMHLHPYAESMELRDLTAGASIYKGVVKDLKGKVGIAKLTHFSSEAGVPVYTDHQYELVAVYNNTTDHDIDAMAIMFVYLLDKDFDRDRLHAFLPESPPGDRQKT